MNLNDDMRLPRSPLSQYNEDFVTDQDEEDYIEDGSKLWLDGLTSTIYHWKLDRVNSVRHPILDEWTTEIYGDPFSTKGRLEATPSEDIMKIIGTGRDFDGILTVHKALLDSRQIDVDDLFSYKDQFYKINYIDADNLFKEHNLFLLFGVYKRNTPELEVGVNTDILN